MLLDLEKGLMRPQNFSIHHLFSQGEEKQYKYLQDLQPGTLLYCVSASHPEHGRRISMVDWGQNCLEMHRSHYVQTALQYFWQHPTVGINHSVAQYE